MYCPKCGSEATENQRFCKLCGTNIQLIHDTLKGNDSLQSPFGIDVDKLTQNAVEFAKSWKSGWHEQWNTHTGPGQARPTARQLKKQVLEEARLRNMPKPKEWLSYSWQHNLKDGLMSLFSGVGLGILLYYLGQEAINSGVIRDISELSARQAEAIERGLRWVWLIGLLPSLKGMAQIIYAAFFGESIATLTARFTTPHRELASDQDSGPIIRDHATSPSIQHQDAQQNFEGMNDPPSSVTERTTHIFDSTQPKRETQ
jgi:zinc-ribbon domain